MAKTLSLAEMRTMQAADLCREIDTQRRIVAKLRLAVKLRKEKGVHLLHEARQQLARMLTVLRELKR
jgi:ribosomal protein L29